MPRSGTTFDAVEGRSRRSLPFERAYPGPIVYVGWAIAAFAVIMLFEALLHELTPLVP